MRSAQPREHTHTPRPCGGLSGVHKTAFGSSVLIVQMRFGARFTGSRAKRPSLVPGTHYALDRHVAAKTERVSTCRRPLGQATLPACRLW